MMHTSIQLKNESCIQVDGQLETNKSLHWCVHLPIHLGFLLFFFLKEESCVLWAILEYII